ncbi:MAG: HAD family hydrolase [Parvularculaceae bacterium]
MKGAGEIKAVIFDCDGVLVDSEVLAIDAARTALAEISFEFSKEEFAERFIGLNDGAFHKALCAEHEARFGARLPEGFFERLISERRARHREMRPVAGAELALRAAPQRRAVASSTRAQYLEGKLKRAGLWDLVAPHIYSADLVARGKPAPDIFLYAAAMLDVPPEACLVIEDSVNGVRAGRAAGMQVWGFIGGGHASDATGAQLRDAGAQIVIEDMRALAARFSRSGS